MPLLLKTVEPARGLRWVSDAFRLFQRRPLPFALMFMVFLFVAMFVSIVPLLGAVLQFALMPLLSLGYMVASQSALLDGPVSARQFAEPLQGDPQRRRSLLVLCAIYGVAAFLILMLANVVSDNAMGRLQQLMVDSNSTPAEVEAVLNEPGVSNAGLLALVLGVVLSVPFWHAPALVHWGGQGVAQALFSSALAVWRAKGAFLVYFAGWTLLGMAAGLVAAMVLGLFGMQQAAGLVVLPLFLFFSTVFYVSLLFTFNDSFGGAAAVRPAAP